MSSTATTPGGEVVTFKRHDRAEIERLERTAAALRTALATVEREIAELLATRDRRAKRRRARKAG